MACLRRDGPREYDIHCRAAILGMKHHSLFRLVYLEQATPTLHSTNINKIQAIQSQLSKSGRLIPTSDAASKIILPVFISQSYILLLSRFQYSFAEQGSTVQIKPNSKRDQLLLTSIWLWGATTLVNDTIHIHSTISLHLVAPQITLLNIFNEPFNQQIINAMKSRLGLTRLC